VMMRVPRRPDWARACFRRYLRPERLGDVGRATSAGKGELASEVLTGGYVEANDTGAAAAGQEQLFARRHPVGAGLRFRRPRRTSPSIHIHIPHSLSTATRPGRGAGSFAALRMTAQERLRDSGRAPAPLPESRSEPFLTPTSAGSSPPTRCAAARFDPRPDTWGSPPRWTIRTAGSACRRSRPPCGWTARGSSRGARRTR
jgi:hypothetical protein